MFSWVLSESLFPVLPPFSYSSQCSICSFVWWEPVMFLHFHCVLCLLAYVWSEPRKFLHTWLCYFWFLCWENRGSVKIGVMMAFLTPLFPMSLAGVRKFHHYLVIGRIFAFSLLFPVSLALNLPPALGNWVPLFSWPIPLPRSEITYLIQTWIFIWTVCSLNFWD